jgi:hypothetical protein
MNKTPEQIEAAITRLMLQTSAIEKVLCATASLLTTEQMRQVRDRTAWLSALQETVDGERSRPMAQDLLQPALDRLFGMLEGANRQFSRPPG